MNRWAIFGCPCRDKEGASGHPMRATIQFAKGVSHSPRLLSEHSTGHPDLSPMKMWSGKAAGCQWFPSRRPSSHARSRPVRHPTQPTDESFASAASRSSPRPESFRSASGRRQSVVNPRDPQNNSRFTRVRLSGVERRSCGRTRFHDRLTSAARSSVTCPSSRASKPICTKS